MHVLFLNEKGQIVRFTEVTLLEEGENRWLLESRSEGKFDVSKNRFELNAVYDIGLNEINKRANESQ